MNKDFRQIVEIFSNDNKESRDFEAKSPGFYRDMAAKIVNFGNNQCQKLVFLTKSA